MTKAIVEGDFAFFDYLQKISPSEPMSRTEATEYIKSVDIRKVLQRLSYVAQIERDSIRKRQAEGIAAAKARGVRFGRQALPRPENFSSVFDLWSAGKISARKAGKILGVAHQTFLKWARAENN